MIIDLDSHLREHYFMDEVFKLEGDLAQYTPVCVEEGEPHERKFELNFPGIARNAVAPRGYNHNFMYDPKANWRGGDLAARQVVGYDMAKRVEGNKLESLDKQILFPTTIAIPAMTEGRLGAALARSYNNWVANLVKGYEDELLPVAMVPAGCPDEMANELRYAVKELGMKAAHLVCYHGTANLDHEQFFPYYEAVQELDVPLFCHPNGQMGFITERFGNFLAMHTLGRPTNCTQALVALVAGGVFERFPKLKVAFFECSAEFPLYWMHRMDDDFEWLKDDQDKLGLSLSMDPSEYVKRNCYFTLEADEHPGALRLAIEEVGEDRFFMATDYPHYDSEYPNTVTKLRGNSLLSPIQKEKILGENARELLRV